MALGMTNAEYGIWRTILMSKTPSQQTEDPPILKNRLASLFYISVLALSIYMILVLRGKSFLANISRLQNNNIYVAVSNWDVAALISIPCFIVLIAVLILRLRSNVNEAQIQGLLKVAIAFALVAVIARVVFGFLGAYYMESKGYTLCPYYISPALMSPNIWVSSPAYCVENSGSVRKPLLKWFDSLPDFGRNTTQEDVYLKVEQLLTEYESRNP